MLIVVDAITRLSIVPRLTLALLIFAPTVFAWTQREPLLNPGYEFWTGGPWVFSEIASHAALGRIHHRTNANAARQTIPLHLDDGTTGKLSVTAGPCDGEECDPDDCGCMLPDSYWIDAVDSVGHRIAHLHLWAAYGVFDVVPVDLIDGPGDELVIVRTPAHSAPPHPPDLKIWKIKSRRPTNLVAGGEQEWFAGRLDSGDGAIFCTDWRSRLFVNPDAPKPRPISLHVDLAAAPGCQLNPNGGAQLKQINHERVLQYQAGTYHLH